LLVLVATVGCSGPPPAVTDVAGVYHLAPDSVVLLQHKKGFASSPGSEIRLSPDGTAVISALPDAYVDGHGRGSGKVVSGSGHWSIEKVRSGYGVTFDIKSGGTMPRSVYDGSSVTIEGRGGHYRLEMILGDPDTHETLEFVRSES